MSDIFVWFHVGVPRKPVTHMKITHLVHRPNKEALPAKGDFCRPIQYFIKNISPTVSQNINAALSKKPRVGQGTFFKYSAMKYFATIRVPQILFSIPWRTGTKKKGRIFSSLLKVGKIAYFQKIKYNKNFARLVGA